MSSQHKKKRTFGEYTKTPEYQARLREVEERMARNAAEARRLQAPLLEELAAVGMHVTTLGGGEDLTPFKPFSKEITDIFLKWLPNAHPRIQHTLVHLLAHAKPFDGTVLTELFETSSHPQLPWQIGNTIEMALPANVTDWVLDTIQDKSVGKPKEMLLIAAAKLAPPEQVIPMIMDLYDKHPLHAATALGHIGGEKELAFLERRLKTSKPVEHAGIRRAIKSIKKRLFQGRGDSPAAIVEQPSTINSSIVSDDVRKNLTEASMNFDLVNVRPFLERIRPHIRSGFGDVQIDDLVEFIESTPVEDEREMQFAVVYRDSPTPLVVVVFMDDVDSPDLYFFTSAELAEKISNECDAFSEELEI